MCLPKLRGTNQSSSSPSLKYPPRCEDVGDGGTTTVVGVGSCLSAALSLLPPLDLLLSASASSSGSASSVMTLRVSTLVPAALLLALRRARSSSALSLRLRRRI